MSSIENSSEYFIYMDEEERKKRDFVIYNAESISCSWPTKNMIFFKSSGSSNIGSDWLSNTYFPTNGLSCHVENAETNVNIFNKFGDHTGLETMRHVHGHIIKLSDYTKILKRKEQIEKTSPSAYYEFKQLAPFYKFLTEKLIYFITNEDFINENKNLILERKEKYKKYTYYIDLLNAITNYFSCEDQLKISYALSDNNEGLWSWEFCNITLADICKERWEELPDKINKVKSDIDKEYLNTDETYNYIVYKEADTDFDTFLKFIMDNNLFKRYGVYSEFLNEYRETYMLGNVPLIFNKALKHKKNEDKRLQLPVLPPQPQPEPQLIRVSSVKISPEKFTQQDEIMEQSVIETLPEIRDDKIKTNLRASVKKREFSKPNFSEMAIKRTKYERENKITERRGTRLNKKGGYKKYTIRKVKKNNKKNKKSRKNKKRKTRKNN